jgi:hypothetical protein
MATTSMTSPGLFWSSTVVSFRTLGVTGGAILTPSTTIFLGLRHPVAELIEIQNGSWVRVHGVLAPKEPGDLSPNEPNLGPGTLGGRPKRKREDTV